VSKSWVRYVLPSTRDSDQILLDDKDRESADRELHAGRSLLSTSGLRCGCSEKQMALERRKNAENQQRQMQSQAQQLFRRGFRRDDGQSN